MSGLIPSGASQGSSPLARGLLKVFRVSGGRIRIIPARAGFTCEQCKAEACPWDHPRSRGVYQGLSALAVEHAGSSPLARGLRVLPRRAAHGAGIIPARAGFTIATLLPRLTG